MEYDKLLHLFSEPLAQQSPPHYSFDHQIQVQEGKKVLFGSIRYLLEKELEALQENLDCRLARGKIAESNTNMGAPIIFVSKSNGKLQFFVNY
jgi:hypothetical protein